MCPSGRDEDGQAAWVEVGPPHNGRANRCGAWHNDTRPEDLAELLSRLLPLWQDPEPTDQLRSAATASILSNGTGFVEQRVVTATSALETVSWATEVIEGGMDGQKWM